MGIVGSNPTRDIFFNTNLKIVFNDINIIFHLLIHLEDFISLNKKKEFENILIAAALNFEFIF